MSKNKTVISKMNTTTREQIFAAKEKLHQLTEKAREEEKEKASQTQKEKRQGVGSAREAEKIARSREEENYLKKHNKTVKQVLSQAARLARGEEEEASPEEEGSESDEDEESSDDGDREEERGPQVTAGGGKEVGKDNRVGDAADTILCKYSALTSLNFLRIIKSAYLHQSRVEWWARSLG